MALIQRLEFLNSPDNKNRIEFICFCLVAVLVLNRILAMGWFVTEDGASHSYKPVYCISFYWATIRLLVNFMLLIPFPLPIG
jgi:hypothetical protein